MRTGLGRVEITATTEHEDESSSESSDEGSTDGELETLRTPSQHKGKRKASDEDEHGQNIIVQTNFDAYFTYAASRAQTSANVYSDLVLPMTPEEYATGINAAQRKSKPLQTSLLEPQCMQELHSRLMFEMQEGFNILCYGYGSKRNFLNEFATTVCSKRGHVVIANGFQPNFSIKDLMCRIEEVPGLDEFEGSSGTVDKQATRIHEFFAQPTQKRHLYLVIHNVDSPPLRTTRARAILGLLGLNPRIHIIASIDHINSSLLWSSSEVSSRKPIETSSTPSSIRGFSWLWHDLTTLASYDTELAFSDRSSIAGAHGGRRKIDLSATNPAAMSETAAAHILASVTQKAKKLFYLLGSKQLEGIAEAGDGATNDMQQYGMTYDALVNAARADFIAVSDTALRSLLGEFRDHSLVLSAPDASGETLWIPLRKERLQAVLGSLQIT